MQSIVYYMKDLPSGGILPHKIIKNYNKDTFSFTLSGLSYQEVLELDKAKSSCTNKLAKLEVLIRYLIPNELMQLPICDMFYIMLQRSLLSGLDFIGDTKNQIAYEKANPGKFYQNKPYFLSKVVCPHCGKVHNQVAFDLNDIEIMRLEDDLMAGRKRWKDIIGFDFNGKDVFYDFEFPTIKKFWEVLKVYLSEYNSTSDEDYYLQLKIITLATALTLHKENQINDEVSDINCSEKINNIKDIFNNITGGDAMKIESLYSDLIQPIAFIRFDCLCKGGSVIDITYSITDILRLIFINRERVIQQIYDIEESIESEHSSDGL